MSKGRLENPVQQDILCEFGAFKYGRLWRMNVGLAMPYNGGAPIMYGVDGQADCEGVLDFRHSSLWTTGMLPVSGIRWCVETKREKGGRVRQSQTTMMRCMERFGAVYMISRSTDEVWDLLGKLGFSRL